MRGRKPKPTVKKKLEGNRGKRKLNGREPQPKISTDMKPRRMKTAPVTVDGAMVEAMVQAFAKTYAPQLQTLGLLTDVDHAAFELMSVHYALACTATELVQREGLVVTGVKIDEKKHPLLQVIRENSIAFRGYAAEFGMTPSARSRLKTPETPGMEQLEMELFGPNAQVAKGE